MISCNRLVVNDGVLDSRRLNEPVAEPDRSVAGVFEHCVPVEAREDLCRRRDQRPAVTEQGRRARWLPSRCARDRRRLGGRQRGSAARERQGRRRGRQVRRERSPEYLGAADAPGEHGFDFNGGHRHVGAGPHISCGVRRFAGQCTNQALLDGLARFVPSCRAPACGLGCRSRRGLGGSRLGPCRPGQAVASRGSACRGRSGRCRRSPW